MGIKTKSVFALAICLLVAFAAAFIGSVASIGAQDFYYELNRPDWAPPGSVFGPVWTFLYTCMALASWMVWNEGGMRNFAALLTYTLQLILNAFWSWLFFAWRRGDWAFVEITMLWCLVLLTIILFWRIHRGAALLLVPYLIWVSFAAYLNYTVWHLNPNLLS